MRNTIIWFIWESQNKWSNSLLGSLGKSELCWQSLPYAGVAGRPMFSLHQYRWSSRFAIFSSFSCTNPFYSSLSRWWMCRLWWCHVLQVATAQQHTAARSDETKCTRLLPALAALQPSYVQANFTGTLKRREKASGVTALFTTHLNCKGGQEMELWSNENGSSGLSDVWESMPRCSSLDMNSVPHKQGSDLWLTLTDHDEWIKGLLGPFGQEAGKKFPELLTGQKYMKHWIAIPVKHYQGSSPL